MRVLSRFGVAPGLLVGDLRHQINRDMLLYLTVFAAATSKGESLDVFP